MFGRAQEHRARTKEYIGSFSDNDGLRQRGQHERMSGRMKQQAMRAMRDALKDIREEDRAERHSWW